MKSDLYEAQNDYPGGQGCTNKIWDRYMYARVRNTHAQKMKVAQEG